MTKIKWIWLVVLYMALHKPYRALSHSKGIWYFQPSITRPSLRNSISTFSYFFFRYLPDGYQTLSVEYKPYTVAPSEKSETENILLIFGESLYAPHLQIYGYNRETFPLMAQRIKNNSDWKISLGISGGIATATSSLLFFNGVREPANMNEVNAKTANLFRLAKQAGFKTYYFSNQESRLTMSYGMKNLDKVVTNDMRLLFFSRYHDEGLAKLLHEVDFSKGKNFVVLHMRSPHSPFENRYKGREDEFEKFKPAAESKDKFEYYQNTYDNALLYTDMVINKMVEEFENLNGDKKHSIYITADHGELFNYDGMYGHNNLVIEQAKVPFFMKKKNSEDLPSVLSYIQIGKIIAGDFGFNIINPNEEDNVFYIHGNNIDFPYDYIKYRIDDNGEITQIEKNNTTALQ
ncbi:MAG: sulfatase-like hydrolase/transferase [Alphaproteobacteria bacterium]|nr:sulfatase-like hydrolase/transferase [Alphaproteobacteria bacterium]